jgi:signal transduction histidine kinase
MPQEIIEKLFRIDSSITTEGTNNEKGTGLGLVLCKELIEKNGGTISVKSEVNKGSEFIVLLPKNG